MRFGLLQPIDIRYVTIAYVAYYAQQGQKRCVTGSRMICASYYLHHRSKLTRYAAAKHASADLHIGALLTYLMLNMH